MFTNSWVVCIGTSLGISLRASPPQFRIGPRQVQGLGQGASIGHPSPSKISSLPIEIQNLF